MTFPPRPRLLGRRPELRALRRVIRSEHPTVLALVGAGGSGKSTLAAALAHSLRPEFAGGLHWFRVGDFGAGTLATMMALRFGVSTRQPFSSVRRHLRRNDATLIVLDNHENDVATSTLLARLVPSPASFVITARRCLLGGVRLHPVTPPLAGTDEHPFPRVARLTRLLRHHPLSLSVADALVRHRVASVGTLERSLRDAGLGSVSVMEDEDDLPEVRVMVDFCWRRLGRSERRILSVLAHMGGDSMDRGSLVGLAKVPSAALDRVVAWGLVQQPMVERFALHATVQRVVARKTRFDRRRFFRHYVDLVERDPSRLVLEQTHLFAAMDWAQREGEFDDRLRINRLLSALGA